MNPAAPHHPADQARVDRIARAERRMFLTDSPPMCDHGRFIGYCRTCIELTHAELGSVAVRAFYAFGVWPPRRSDGRPFTSYRIGGLARRIAAGAPA